MPMLRQICLFAALLIVSASLALASTKDQSRMPQIDDPSAVAENGQPLPIPDAGTDQTTPDTEQQAPEEGTGDDLTQPPPDQPDASGGEGPVDEDLNLGEIPDIKTVELTVDMAKRALDTYAMVSEKYKDADLASYDDLQDFVDKNEEGQHFEADIKAAGFASVDDWNVAITTLGFAYSAAQDDPSSDIKQQIEEIQADTSIAQDMKDKMIASLSAMIPSDNNKTVVAELMKDPAYAEKLKLLDAADGEGE